MPSALLRKEWLDCILKVEPPHELAGIGSTGGSKHTYEITDQTKRNVKKKQQNIFLKGYLS